MRVRFWPNPTVAVAISKTIPNNNLTNNQNSQMLLWRKFRLELDIYEIRKRLNSGKVLNLQRLPLLPLQQMMSYRSFLIHLRWWDSMYHSCDMYNPVDTKHFCAAKVIEDLVIINLLLRERKSCPDESLSIEMSARFHSNWATHCTNDLPFL